VTEREQERAAIVEWLFGPFHQMVASFGLPAITVGALGGSDEWMAFAGALGVVAFFLLRLHLWRGDHLKGGK